MRILLSMMVVIAFLTLSTSPSNKLRQKIALLETFAKKLERAQRIAPETSGVIEGLIAAVAMPQADPALENWRRATIARLEIQLAHSRKLAAMK